MIDQVRPADLGTWFQAHSSRDLGAVLLDVREPWELAAASVTPAAFGLLTIPMNQIPARLGELDPAQPVACLCHHGARSQRVALFLEQHGFSELANVAGGIDAWSCEVDPRVPRY